MELERLATIGPLASASFAAQKIGALSGTGVLWVRGIRKRYPAFLLSSAAATPGKQESGLRGGTENLLGAVAAGEAAQAIVDAGIAGLAEKIKVTAAIRDAFEADLKRTIDGVVVHGDKVPRACNTSQFGFLGIEGQGLVLALDMEGFAVSAGSACSAGTMEPSRVLLAMGVEPGLARASLRVSLSMTPGKETTSEELRGFLVALKRVIDRFRKEPQG